MQKEKLITDDDNESIYYAPKSEFDDKDDEYKKNQQNNNIDTKPPNFSNYFKSLSPEAKYLMYEIDNADDDIYDDKPLFVGSNQEKFNFYTFRKSLNFISAIYNGEISLKEAKLFQKNLESKIEDLKFNSKAKNEKEEEKEIYIVLMHANDLSEYRNKIINAF